MRLGAHYDMQSAQRLAQDRLQERCDQSGGHVWMIKIDKMDSSAIRCPTQWRLLNTAFFRDGNRVEVGLIGSWWSGLRQSAPIHFRTIFDDLAETGSSMQFSTLLLNLNEKVVKNKTNTKHKQNNNEIKQLESAFRTTPSDRMGDRR